MQRQAKIRASGLAANFSVVVYRRFSVRQGFTFSAMNRENIVGCVLQAHERRVRAQQEHPADGARRAAAYAGVVRYSA